MSDLKKTLGLGLLTFYGTGMIIGAGIYSIIGSAAGIAGESLWMSFILSAAISLLTGLSYAEMATMYPKAGAEYVYLKAAFPRRPIIAAGVGWMVAIGLATTAAAVAVAFAGYLNHFVSAPIMLVAFGLMVFFTLINILGIKESSWTNVIFTLIEISGLIIFIYLGIRHESFGDPIMALPHGGILPASALLIFSYFGFENIANLAEEVHNPGKVIPRAIFLSLGVSTLIYLLVSFSALALLSPAELAASSKPLADAVGKISPRLAGILSGIALFSTANTALIALLITSRVLFGMARGGDLPKVLSHTHPIRNTPWIASFVSLIFASAFLPLGNVEALGNLSSMSTMVAFIGVSIALLVLRKTHPHLERPYRVPFSVEGIPVLPIASIISIGTLLMQFSLSTYLWSGVGLTVFLFVYFILKLINGDKIADVDNSLNLE